MPEQKPARHFKRRWLVIYCGRAGFCFDASAVAHMYADYLNRKYGAGAATVVDLGEPGPGGLYRYEED